MHPQAQRREFLENMPEQIQLSEIIADDFPNVYIEYRSGGRFLKRDDALLFIGNLNMAKFTLKHEIEPLLCTRLILANPQESVSIFYTPLLPAKKLISMR